MNKDLANFSTDLRRVSYWIYEGKIDLAKRFLRLAKGKYKLTGRIGPYPDIWQEIEKINNLEGGNYRSSDRAATISSILLNESLK